MPTCTTCKTPRDIKDFYQRKNGSLRKDCKFCCRITKSIYYKNNREKIKKQINDYRSLNPEKIKSDAIEYYKNNKEKIKSSQKAYFNSPQGRLCNLLHSAETRSKGSNFDLDIEYLMELYNKQSGKCLLTNTVFI